jgi:HSP90 family molecular chaperone
MAVKVNVNVTDNGIGMTPDEMTKNLVSANALP